jgi:hypothetical protein
MIPASVKKALAVAGLLAAAVFLLYRKSARLYWTYDSPMLLHRALERDWTWEYLIPDTGQFLFTPLLSSTYELWLALFGLEPSRWYLAQLVLIACTYRRSAAKSAIAVDPLPAASGALLFVLGPPVVHAAATLYVPHYLEAIFFGALATIGFVLGLRRERIGFSIAAAVCYAVALFAKEIAAGLPLVLLLLPERDLRTRVRHLMPLAVGAIGYASWRLFVVRVPTIPYGWDTTFADALTLPWRLIAVTAGASLAAGLILMALMLAAAIPKLRWRIAVVALLCAVGPIMPVSAEMQDRFALPFWLWLCCTFALGVRKPLLIAATVVVALIANRQEWTAEFTRTKRMSDEAHVWVHERGDVLLRNPAIPAGTMPHLSWLKEEHFHHAKGSRWFYDDLYLCLRSVEGRRILEYDPRTRRVEEVKASCQRGREDVPLTVDFEFEPRGNTLHWRLGPYRDGTWRMLAFGGEHAWEVPREGAYRIGSIQLIDLRVRYTSPEGWVTYSPPFALDFARQRKTTWRR